MDRLKAMGWSLKDQAWQDLMADCPSSPVGIEAVALDIDLRKVGQAVLPEDINRAAVFQLKGPHVLQIVSCQDIAHPSKGVSSDSQKKRILTMRLTDGKTTCKALEYHAMPELDIAALAPGCKVCVRNAIARNGLLLLDTKCFQVLGGRVEELYEAWDFQRTYGAGAARPQETDNPMERPPPFKAFVPGMAPARRRVINEGKPPSEQPKQDQAKPRLILERPRPPMQQAAAPASSAASAQEPDSSRVTAAKTKLQERLAANAEASHSMRGGRGRRCGGRNGHRFDDSESTNLTLDEWEAQQKLQQAGRLADSGATGSNQIVSDEELARQLQRQLDMAAYEQEDTHQHHHPPGLRSAEEDLKVQLFAYRKPNDDARTFIRGRSRGRGRR